MAQNEVIHEQLTRDTPEVTDYKNLRAILQMALMGDILAPLWADGKGENPLSLDGLELPDGVFQGISQGDLEAIRKGSYLSEEAVGAIKDMAFKVYGQTGSDIGRPLPISDAGESMGFATLGAKVRHVAYEEFQSVLDPKRKEAFEEEYDAGRIYATVETESVCNPVVSGPTSDGGERQGHGMNRVTLYVYKHGCQLPQFLVAYADSSGRIVDSPLTSRTFPLDGFLDRHFYDPAVRAEERPSVGFFAEEGGFDLPLSADRYAAVVERAEQYLGDRRASSNSKRYGHMALASENTKAYDDATMAKNAIERELAPLAARAKIADGELHSAVQSGRGIAEAAKEFVGAASEFYGALGRLVGDRGNIPVIGDDRDAKGRRMRDSVNAAKMQRWGFQRLYADDGLLRADNPSRSANPLKHAAALFAAGQDAAARPSANNPAERNAAVDRFVDEAIASAVTRHNRKMKAEFPNSPEYHMLYISKKSGKVYTYFGTEAHSGQYFRDAKADGELLEVVLQGYEYGMDKSLLADKSINLKEFGREDARQRISGMLAKASGESIPSNISDGADISGVPLLDYLTVGIEAFANRGIDETRVFLKDWSGEDTLDETAATAVYEEHGAVGKALTAIHEAKGDKAALAAIADALARDCVEARGGKYDLESAMSMDSESPAQRGRDAEQGKASKAAPPSDIGVGAAVMRQIAGRTDTSPNVYGRLNRDKTLKPEITAVKRMELRNEADKEAKAEGLTGDALSKRSDALYKEKVDATARKLESLLSNARQYEAAISRFGLGHIEQGGNAVCVDLKAQHTAALYAYGRLGGVIGPSAAVVSGCGPIALAQAGSAYSRISIAETIKVDVVRALERRAEIRHTVDAAMPGILADAERMADKEGLAGDERKSRIDGYVESRKAAIRDSFPKTGSGYLYHLFNRMSPLNATDENGQPMTLDRYSSFARNFSRAKLGIGVAAALIVAPVFPLVTAVAIAGPILQGLVGGVIAVETGKKLEKGVERKMDNGQAEKRPRLDDMAPERRDPVAGGAGGDGAVHGGLGEAEPTKPEPDGVSADRSDASVPEGAGDAAGKDQADNEAPEALDAGGAPAEKGSAGGQTQPVDDEESNLISQEPISADELPPPLEPPTEEEMKEAEAMLAAIPDNAGGGADIAEYQPSTGDGREPFAPTDNFVGMPNVGNAREASASADGLDASPKTDTDHADDGEGMGHNRPETVAQNEAVPQAGIVSGIAAAIPHEAWDGGDGKDMAATDAHGAEPGTDAPQRTWADGALDKDAAVEETRGPVLEQEPAKADSVAPADSQKSGEEAAREDLKDEAETEAAQELAAGLEIMEAESDKPSSMGPGGNADVPKPEPAIMPDVGDGPVPDAVDEEAAKGRPAKEADRPDAVDGARRPADKDGRRKELSKAVAAYLGDGGAANSGLDLILDICGFLNPMAADAADIAKALVDTVMDGVDAAGGQPTADALLDAARLISDISTVMDAGSVSAMATLDGEWDGKGDVLREAQGIFEARLPEGQGAEDFAAAFTVEHRFVELPSQFGALFLGEDGLLYTSQEAAILGMEEGIADVVLDHMNLADADAVVPISMEVLSDFHDAVMDIATAVAEQRGYDPGEFLSSEEGAALKDSITSDVIGAWAADPDTDITSDAFKDQVIQEHAAPAMDGGIVTDAESALASDAAVRAAANAAPPDVGVDAGAGDNPPASDLPTYDSGDPKGGLDAQASNANHAPQESQPAIDAAAPTADEAVETPAEAGAGKAADPAAMYDLWIDRMPSFVDGSAGGL